MPPMKKPAKIIVDGAFLSHFGNGMAHDARLFVEAWLRHARSVKGTAHARRIRLEREMMRQLNAGLKGKHPLHGIIVVAPFKHRA